MCGIVTVLKFTETKCLNGVVDRMMDEVIHRGPDDQGKAFFGHIGGCWVQTSNSDSIWQVGLGHRRLSILDLSSGGHQPMAYQGKYWIVYNGEVYNFIELRAELIHSGHVFRTGSDTEVILASYAEWGVKCFRRFRGMWGLVILDTARNEVILSRDRMGIKPLYFWEGPGMVAVASEIKQFYHLPGFIAHVDLSVASEYLRTGYENSDRSFFKEVCPVQSGTWLRIPINTLKPSRPESFWEPERVEATITNSDEASQLFSEKLKESVGIHLRSDVPVGISLSGGLDSGSIAFFANSFRNGKTEPFHTFTSTFPGSPIDEREYVECVLNKIPARTHFTTPTPDRFIAEMDRLIWTHDEPVGSSSVYAPFCIARIAREDGVPVTLSGQGGDEILSGYWQTYFVYLRSLLRSGQILLLANHIGGAFLKDGNLDLLKQAPVMIRRYRARNKPQGLIRIRKPMAKNGTGALDEILSLDGQARRLYEIRKMFLPRLLKWDDRNSMAFSIETRYPFLDHELIELSLSFAPHTLFHRGWTKWPLRLGLKNLLPSKIVYRQAKFAHDVPQDEWLCGPLRPVLIQWLEQDRPVWDYVERRDAEQLAERTWQVNGKHEELGQALFRLFIFDRWLELFRIGE